MMVFPQKLTSLITLGLLTTFTVVGSAAQAPATKAPAAKAPAAKAPAKATQRFEVTSIKAVRPTLVRTVAALEKGDGPGAKAAFDAYDSGWNGIEVYINVRSADMYAALEKNYQTKIAEGLKAQTFSDGVLGEGMKRGGFGPKDFAPLAEAAGKLLAAGDGPRLAVLEMGGWDTHVNQGAEQGRLAQNLAGYADGLDALATAMGAAWRQTVVIGVTEFGRTVAVNGNGGTDHGTASVLFLMGGAVKGGRLLGDWPGLAQLEDNRDLRVATDSRRVMKGILRDHLGIDAGALDSGVFPDTPNLRPFDGLLKA